MAGKDLIRNYQPLIYEFRDKMVMIDNDLALLYGVSTKSLKQQVKRNIKRFPPDFMFELNKEEFESLRSQIVTSKRGGSRYMPMAFTEHGIAMISSVINSEKAIQINIEIIRAFASYRLLLHQNEDLKQSVMALEEKLNQAFKFLLDRMDTLQEKSQERKRQPLGYQLKKKK